MRRRSVRHLQHQPRNVQTPTSIVLDHIGKCSFWWQWKYQVANLSSRSRKGNLQVECRANHRKLGFGALIGVSESVVQDMINKGELETKVSASGRKLYLWATESERVALRRSITVGAMRSMDATSDQFQELCRA